MQGQINNDPRIKLENGNKNALPAKAGLGIVVYPLKATFTQRKNTNYIKDKATQNLKQFTTEIMNDPLIHNYGDPVNNINNVSNQKQSFKTIVQSNQINTKSKNHQKLINSETLQVLSRIPSLQTKIPTGQYDKITISHSNTLIQNVLNESHSHSSRSIQLSVHKAQTKISSETSKSKGDNVDVKVLNAEGNLLENARNQQQQKLQNSGSLLTEQQKYQLGKKNSLPISEQTKKLNSIISNTSDMMKNHPFLNERKTENGIEIAETLSSVRNPQSNEENHQANIVSSQQSVLQIRKQSQDTIQNSISEPYQFGNGNVESDQTLLQNGKLIFQNKNSLNMTDLTKGITENSVNQLNNLLSNPSNNKVLTESYDEQQMLHVITSSNKTIDTTYLIGQANTLATSEKHLQNFTHQSLALGKDLISNEQIRNILQKDQPTTNSFLKKSLSIQHNSSNPFETEKDVTSANPNQQKHVSSTQIGLAQNGENKTTTNFFHSRQKSDNLYGITYLTNHSKKSSMYSPKSTHSNLITPKSKPFYHPFFHLSTSLQGDDQNIASQFFIQNLSKYNQSGLSTRKSSTSHRLSISNTIRHKDASQMLGQQQAFDKYISSNTVYDPDQQNKIMSKNLGMQELNGIHQEVDHQTHHKQNNYSQKSISQKSNKDVLSNQIKQTINRNASLKVSEQISPRTEQTTKENKNSKLLEIFKVNESNQELMKQELNPLQEKEDEDLEFKNSISKKKNSLFNLMFDQYSETPKIQNNQWNKIFQSYMDSKDYLFKSKRSIPQKKKNLLYEYKQNGIHKSQISMASVYSTVQQSQQKSTLLQSPDKSQKKRGSQNKLQDRNYLLNPKNGNSFGVLNQYDDILNNNKKSMKKQMKKVQSLSPIKIQIPLNQYSPGDERTSIVLNGINNRQSIYKRESLMPSMTGSQYNLNMNGSLNSLLKDQSQLDAQATFMTYRDRSKNESYQSTAIAEDLIIKKKIDDDPEIAEQKIKLTKYFLDDSIPIQEKRNNFKEIQMLFLPENKKFDEKVCHEVLPFLNIMKHYFLKQEFISPLSSIQNFLRSDSKSKLMRGKTGHIVTQYVSSELSSPGTSLSKFGQIKSLNKVDEIKTEKGSSAQLKGEDASSSQDLQYQKSPSSKKQQNVIFFVDD